MRIPPLERSLLAVAVGLGIAQADTLPLVRHVIVISVDGMGSEYVTPLLAAGLTNELTTFKRFQTEGAGTLNARGDADFAVTLPNHVSMMTGRGVIGAAGHHWTINQDPLATATLATNKGAYVASGFDVAHDHGLRTGIWSGKSKFSLFQQSFSTTSGAPDTIGDDHGCDKIDYDRVVAGIPAAELTADLLNEMADYRYDFVFFHYQDPDAAGHAFGWSANPASAYATTLKAVDTQIGNLMRMIENSPTLQGHTAIILTADHGGHGTTHGDPRNYLDYTIPFYVWGPGVTAGGDLYAMNPASRTAPGATTHPPYTGGQPVRNGDCANLALNMLGLPPVPGSTIDSAQDLMVGAPVTSPIVMLDLAGSPLAEAGGLATVTATLSAAAAQEVTVKLAFAGTATPASDYTGSGPSIRIEAGTISGSITLTAILDEVEESPAETIVVDIDTVVNATESGTQQVTATIADHDPAAGIAVGALGSDTIPFDTLPGASQWSTLSVSGSAADLTGDSDLDSAMSDIAATMITGTLATQAGSGTNPIAYWRPDDLKLGIQPTDNKMTLLMATLRNTSGSAMDGLTVSYTLGLPTVTVTPAETIKGLRVYWSKTGTVGSWTVARDFVLTAAGGLLRANCNLAPLVWEDGQPLYVVWAHDNGGNPDGNFTLDDVRIQGFDLFTSWIFTNYPALGDKSPAADPDGDGMTNQAEFAFGSDPSNGAVATSIASPLNLSNGTFSYTRRDPVRSGLTYTVWTSTDLQTWTPDPATELATGGDVQTVTVTLSAGIPLITPILFVRISAE
jgi:hypothetical protein